MSGTTAIEGVELDGFIKAQAHLEHAPNDVEGVVRALALPDVDAWKRVEQGWRARMGEDEHLADVVEIFLRDYIAELRGPSAEGATAATGGAEVPAQRVRQEMASYMQAPSAHATPLPPRPLAVLSPSAPTVHAPVAPASSPVRVALPAPETAEVDIGKLLGILAANPTPFRGKTSPERLQKLRTESVEAEETQFQGPASSTDEADETMMFQPSASLRVELNTLPFAKIIAKVAYPELSVDQYAAFAAEMQAKGVSGAMLDRYKITSSEVLLALRAEQERRFDADPALRARFEERKAHFLRFMQPIR